MRRSVGTGHAEDQRAGEVYQAYTEAETQEREEMKEGGQQVQERRMTWNLGSSFNGTIRTRWCKAFCLCVREIKAGIESAARVCCFAFVTSCLGLIKTKCYALSFVIDFLLKGKHACGNGHRVAVTGQLPKQ